MAEEETDKRAPLEADDEDDWKPPELDENIRPAAVSAPAAHSQLGVELPALTPGVAREIGYAPPVFPQKTEQAAVPVFFKRLETMPLMRQAVILTEILGPPKGE
jgi:hypothetical protein